MKLHWIIFVTGWMSFRAVGSGLFLFWIFTENERSAPSEWIIPFVGDFFIGITALFLGPLKKMKPIQSEKVANAMIKISNGDFRQQVFESNEIVEISNN